MPVSEPEGYTERYMADCTANTLEILVKPDADLDGTFRAWCVDTGEFLALNGWLWIFERIHPTDERN